MPGLRICPARAFMGADCNAHGGSLRMGAWRRPAASMRGIAVMSSTVTGEPASLDVVANRQVRKYSRGEMARRVLWMIVQPLFRFSPRPAFAWRRWLLRRLGAEVGR